MFRCPECQRQLKNRSGLTVHVRSHVQLPDYAEEGKAFPRGGKDGGPVTHSSPFSRKRARPPKGPVEPLDPESLVIGRNDLACPFCGFDKAYVDYWEKYVGVLRCGQCCVLSSWANWLKETPQERKPGGE